MLRLSLAQL